MKTLQLIQGTEIKIRNGLAFELKKVIEKYKGLDVIITLNKDKDKNKRKNIHIDSIKTIL